MTEMNDETAPAYVICVQSAVGDMEVEWYWLEPGDEPVIESVSSRELVISKIPAGEEEEELVAIYGTDCWVRAWAAEYDPDAEPEEEPEG